MVIADMMFGVRGSCVVVLIGLGFAAFFLVHDGLRNKAIGVSGSFGWNFYVEIAIEGIVEFGSL